MKVVAEIVTVLLALAGAFFETVEKDYRGKRKLYHGLPVPTRSGLSIVILVYISGGFAIYKDVSEAHDAEELRTKVKDIQGRANDLQDKATKLQTSNTALGNSLSTDYNDLVGKLATSIGQLQSLETATRQTYLTEEKTLNAVHHARLAEFAIRKITISFDWSPGSSGWHDFEARCPGIRREDTKIEGVASYSDRKPVCVEYRGEFGFSSGYDPSSGNMDSIRMLATLYFLDNLYLQSEASPARRVEFDKAKQIMWSVGPSGVYVEVTDPGVALDWLDGGGISLHMEPGRGSLPQSFSIKFKTDGNFPITQKLIAHWRGHNTGPYPITLTPELLKRLESSLPAPK